MEEDEEGTAEGLEEDIHACIASQDLMQNLRRSYLTAGSQLIPQKSDDDINNSPLLPSSFSSACNHVEWGAGIALSPLTNMSLL